MLQTILDDLWRNWMFRISLSSNELFHSNFLQAALGESELEPGSEPEDEDDKTCLTSWSRVRNLVNWAGLDRAWFDGIERKFGSYSVFLCREWQKLDLAVVVRVQEGAKKPYEVVLFALELKIKSYPSRSQLERYLDAMKTHNGDASGFEHQLVLLSLIRPLENLDKLSQLTIMDFKQLARGLQDFAPSSGTLAPAIEEYVRCCDALHRLSEFWKDQLGPATTLRDVIDMRSAYRRLHPIWSKLCAAYVCELVKEEMTGFDVPDDVELQTVANFSNGSWTADFLWCKREHLTITKKRAQAAAGVIAKVGVQIEGDTFRFMLNALNVGQAGMDARSHVETVLLARAPHHGLYQRLHALHTLRQTQAAGPADPDTLGFWDAHRGVLMLKNGWPALSTPNRNSGYRLTGYNNAVNFGHADYRLKLDPEVSLGQISKMIAAALKGEYNANGHQAFLDVLTDPAAFVVAG